MEAVGGATSSLLPKLGELLQDEYKLQDKVKKDIESLQNELIFMNATLRMVAEVPRDQLDEHVRIWAFFIKEVSYDIEEVVNTFVTRVHTSPYLDGLVRKAFNMLCMGRTNREIAGMVEEIRSLIKEVVELRDRYRLDNIFTRPATLTSVILPQRDNTFVRFLADEYDAIARRLVGIYEEPLGIELDMEDLHNWITSREPHSMLSLVGPAGVGKTTIAMVLYRNYGHQFQRRVMVNVSQNSDDRKTFLLDILNQVKPLELQDHNGNIKKITSELQRCLRGQRLLLLLDDVWSLTTLKHIECTWLRDIDKRSRIIVTTRSDLVARALKMRTGGRFHKIGLLSYEKARQLFMEVAGKQNGKIIPSSLWEMCGGLPLAIVTMAGQFTCDPLKSDKEWITVSSALTPTSGTSQTDYNLTKILNTCYNDMPVEIKACSLYFSIFPRGQKISRKRLTRRWTSDGFVNEQQGLKAEEVAEAYLNHLIRRKVLRAVEHSSNGKVKSYQVMHDKVLENIVSRAREENFVTAIGACGVLPSSTKVRRLSAEFNGSSEYVKEMEIMNLSQVRDVTMFGSLKQLPSSSFKFGGAVQVLDLEGCKDIKQHHTKEIYRMLLLKYLSLRRTDITMLTKRIGDLRFLETLDVRDTNVIERPNAICKLERLANIFGGNKRTRKALKLHKELGRRNNTNALHILTGIDIGEETTGDFHHLIGLRKLAIYKLNNDKEGCLFSELCSSIEYLGGYSLCALVIHDESAEFLKSLDDLSTPPKFLNALDLSGKLIVLPKWIAEMVSLTKLNLSVTALRADNLKVLSKIRSLFSLTFSLNAAKQDQETAGIIEDNKPRSDGMILFPAGGFENLKLLRFFAPYVPQLSFPDGALPTLERLDLQFSNFEGLLGIRGLKNLQQVHIKVHGEASETTESKIKEMATAARENREGPRIIFD